MGDPNTPVPPFEQTPPTSVNEVPVENQQPGLPEVPQNYSMRPGCQTRDLPNTSLHGKRTKEIEMFVPSYASGPYHRRPEIRTRESFNSGPYTGRHPHMYGAQILPAPYFRRPAYQIDMYNSGPYGNRNPEMFKYSNASELYHQNPEFQLLSKNSANLGPSVDGNKGMLGIPNVPACCQAREAHTNPSLMNRFTKSNTGMLASPNVSEYTSGPYVQRNKIIHGSSNTSNPYYRRPDPRMKYLPISSSFSNTNPEIFGPPHVPNIYYQNPGIPKSDLSSSGSYTNYNPQKNMASNSLEPYFRTPKILTNDSSNSGNKETSESTSSSESYYQKPKFHIKEDFGSASNAKGNTEICKPQNVTESNAVPESQTNRVLLRTEVPKIYYPKPKSLKRSKPYCPTPDSQIKKSNIQAPPEFYKPKPRTQIKGSSTKATKYRSSKGSESYCPKPDTQIKESAKSLPSKVPEFYNPKSRTQTKVSLTRASRKYGSSKGPESYCPKPETEAKETSNSVASIQANRVLLPKEVPGFYNPKPRTQIKESFTKVSKKYGSSRGPESYCPKPETQIKEFSNSVLPIEFQKFYNLNPMTQIKESFSIASTKYESSKRSNPYCSKQETEFKRPSISVANTQISSELLPIKAPEFYNVWPRTQIEVSSVKPSTKYGSSKGSESYYAKPETQTDILTRAVANAQISSELLPIKAPEFYNVWPRTEIEGSSVKPSTKYGSSKGSESYYARPETQTDILTRAVANAQISSELLPIKSPEFYNVWPRTEIEGSSVKPSTKYGSSKGSESYNAKPETQTDILTRAVANAQISSELLPIKSPEFYNVWPRTEIEGSSVKPSTKYGSSKGSESYYAKPETQTDILTRAVANAQISSELLPIKSPEFYNVWPRTEIEGSSVKPSTKYGSSKGSESYYAKPKTQTDILTRAVANAQISSELLPIKSPEFYNVWPRTEIEGSSVKPSTKYGSSKGSESYYAKPKTQTDILTRAVANAQISSELLPIKSPEFYNVWPRTEIEGSSVKPSTKYGSSKRSNPYCSKQEAEFKRPASSIANAQINSELLPIKASEFYNVWPRTQIEVSSVKPSTTYGSSKRANSYWSKQEAQFKRPSSSVANAQIRSELLPIKAPEFYNVWPRTQIEVSSVKPSTKYGSSKGSESYYARPETQTDILTRAASNTHANRVFVPTEIPKLYNPKPSTQIKDLSIKAITTHESSNGTESYCTKLENQIKGFSNSPLNLQANADIPEIHPFISESQTKKVPSIEISAISTSSKVSELENQITESSNTTNDLQANTVILPLKVSEFYPLISDSQTKKEPSIGICAISTSSNVSELENQIMPPSNSTINLKAVVLAAIVPEFHPFISENQIEKEPSTGTSPTSDSLEVSKLENQITEIPKPISNLQDNTVILPCVVPEFYPFISENQIQTEPSTETSPTSDSLEVSELENQITESSNLQANTVILPSNIQEFYPFISESRVGRESSAESSPASTSSKVSELENLFKIFSNAASNLQANTVVLPPAIPEIYPLISENQIEKEPSTEMSTTSDSLEVSELENQMTETPNPITNLQADTVISPSEVLKFYPVIPESQSKKEPSTETSATAGSSKASESDSPKDNETSNSPFPETSATAGSSKVSESDSPKDNETSNSPFPETSATAGSSKVSESDSPKDNEASNSPFPETSATAGSSKVSESDSPKDNETFNSPFPETSATAGSTKVSESDSPKDNETSNSLFPETSATAGSSKVPESDSPKDNETSDSPFPETSATAGSSKVSESDSPKDNETSNYPSTETSATAGSSKVSESDSPKDNETSNSPFPETSATAGSSKVSEFDSPKDNETSNSPFTETSATAGSSKVSESDSPKDNETSNSPFPEISATTGSTKVSEADSPKDNETSNSPFTETSATTGSSKVSESDSPKDNETSNSPFTETSATAGSSKVSESGSPKDNETSNSPFTETSATAGSSKVSEFDSPKDNETSNSPFTETSATAGSSKVSESGSPKDNETSNSPFPETSATAGSSKVSESDSPKDNETSNSPFTETSATAGSSKVSESDSPKDNETSNSPFTETSATAGSSKVSESDSPKDNETFNSPFPETSATAGSSKVSESDSPKDNETFNSPFPETSVTAGSSKVSESDSPKDNETFNSPFPETSVTAGSSKVSEFDSPKDNDTFSSPFPETSTIADSSKVSEFDSPKDNETSNFTNRSTTVQPSELPELYYPKQESPNSISFDKFVSNDIEEHGHYLTMEGYDEATKAELQKVLNMPIYHYVGKRRRRKIDKEIFKTSLVPEPIFEYPESHKEIPFDAESSSSEEEEIPEAYEPNHRDGTPRSYFVPVRPHPSVPQFTKMTPEIKKQILEAAAPKLVPNENVPM